MVTSKDMYDLIEVTLQNFKARLANNENAFWSDDEYGEGLQNRVEGLETFFIPFYSKDFKGVSKYFSADEIVKQVEVLHEIIKKDGFKPTPYINADLKEILEKNITKHDFIDSVSYTLTTVVAAMLLLQNQGKLVGKTYEMSSYLLKESIKWLNDSHNPNEGWSGFSAVNNISHIYSTWSALSVIPETNVILADKFKIDEELRTHAKKLIDNSNECKKWLIGFGKNQGKNWECDTKDDADTHVIYTVYGLDSLYLIEAYKEKVGLELMIDTLDKITTVWDDFRDKFLTREVHYLPTIDSKGKNVLIKYEDSSILTVCIKAVSRFASILKGQQLSDPLEKSERVLTEMFEHLKKNRFQDNLWTDTAGGFSIYVTERVTEALVAYERFLTPIVQEQSLISDKIDYIMSKVDSIENLLKSLIVNEELDADTKEKADVVNEMIKAHQGKKK